MGRVALMPEDFQKGRNMYHVLTGIIKSFVVDCNTYINFYLIYHNGMNSTKKVSSY